MTIFILKHQYNKRKKKQVVFDKKKYFLQQNTLQIIFVPFFIHAFNENVIKKPALGGQQNIHLLLELNARFLTPFLSDVFNRILFLILCVIFLLFVIKIILISLCLKMFPQIVFTLKYIFFILTIKLFSCILIKMTNKQGFTQS